MIQSIFRISINDKIRSYGQLRTIGATPKQIKRIVKREGRKLGSIGILIGTVLGVCAGFLLFSKGFNAVSYVVMISLTLISCWFMVSISIRKPVKIAAGISPIEAVRLPRCKRTSAAGKRISSSILFQWELRILSVTKKDNQYCSIFEYRRNFADGGIFHCFSALTRTNCEIIFS